MDGILISLVVGLTVEIFTLIGIIIKNVINNKNLNFKINKQDYITMSNSIRKNDLNKVIEQLKIENEILNEQIKIYENTVPLFNTKSIFKNDTEDDNTKLLYYYVYSVENDKLINNNNIEDINGKKCIILKQGKNFFGRKNSTNVDIDIVDIDDFSVSRIHFAINVFNNLVTIEDCHSTNGTWIDKSKLLSEETPLKSGNTITAGNVNLVFCSDFKNIDVVKTL